MRMKLLPFVFLAGTVVGCASKPPPPPPMVEAPPPPPPAAPVALGPVDGIYKGMAELASDAPRGCAKMTREQTVRVRGNSFVLNGVKGTIAPDGSITAPNSSRQQRFGHRFGNRPRPDLDARQVQLPLHDDQGLIVRPGVTTARRARRAVCMSGIP